MAKSKKQAQALTIKLSRERRGQKTPPPPKNRYSQEARQRARRDLVAGRKRAKPAKHSGQEPWLRASSRRQAASRAMSVYPPPRRIMAFSNFVLDGTTGFDDALAEAPDALGALAPEDKAA
jgi:hypothetical protein